MEVIELHPVPGDLPPLFTRPAGRFGQLFRFFLPPFPVRLLRGPLKAPGLEFQHCFPGKQGSVRPGMGCSKDSVRGFLRGLHALHHVRSGRLLFKGIVDAVKEGPFVQGLIPRHITLRGPFIYQVFEDDLLIFAELSPMDGSLPDCRHKARNVRVLYIDPPCGKIRDILRDSLRHDFFFRHLPAEHLIDVGALHQASAPRIERILDPVLTKYGRNDRILRRCPEDLLVGDGLRPYIGKELLGFHRWDPCEILCRAVAARHIRVPERFLRLLRGRFRGIIYKLLYRIVYLHRLWNTAKGSIFRGIWNGVIFFLSQVHHLPPYLKSPGGTLIPCCIPRGIIRCGQSFQMADSSSSPPLSLPESLGRPKRASAITTIEIPR